jgi:hypothetical protein
MFHNSRLLCNNKYHGHKFLHISRALKPDLLQSNLISKIFYNDLYYFLIYVSLVLMFICVTFTSLKGINVRILSPSLQLLAVNGEDVFNVNC